MVLVLPTAAWPDDVDTTVATDGFTWLADTLLSEAWRI
jgi:hypothetical protein